MKRIVPALIRLFLVLFAGGSCAQELIHNPFVRPAYLENTKSASAETGVIRVDRFDLRATIADGGNSLVNVAGEFYRLGDEIDGYKLISVDVGRAVFVRGDQELVIYVREQP